MNGITKEKTNRAHVMRLYGVIIGLVFIFLGAVGETKAQWAVTVVADTSPTTIHQVQEATKQSILQGWIMRDGLDSKIQNYLHYAKEVQQWLDVINKYSAMIEQNVKRFTSLRGILGVVESQLGLSDDTLKALSDLGQAIRATISLKQQFIGLIRSRLAMIENLERRARSGIFNPQADLADLEDYLTTTMGRTAQARLRTRAKIAEQDPEMERLTVELEKIRASRTAAEKERADINQKLGRETSLTSRPRTVVVGEDGSSTPTTDPNGRTSLSIDGTNTMILRLGQLDQLIADLIKQEQDLVEKIAKRYQQYQARFDEAYFTAEQWKEATSGWTAFTEAKNAELGKLIDNYGNENIPSPSPSPSN